MTTQIQNILKDLYALDPALKKHEKQLVQIVERILAARPDTKFDKKFAQRLRAEILAEIKGQAQEKKLNIFNQLIELFTMKKLAYVAGGVVLTALILIPVINQLINKTPTTLPAQLQISRIADKAFGPINSQGQAAQDNLIAEKTRSTISAPAAIGLGGGTGAATGIGGGGAAVGAPGMMPIYYPSNLQYIYKGDPLNLTESKMAVFKRVKGENASSQLEALVRQFNLGLADLSSFGAGRLQLFSFTQDQPYGYNFTVDVENGTVAIYQNWNNWPQSKCQDENCWQAYQVKASDVPADSELIKIADNFLATHKISKANYGEPYVDKTWQNVMYLKGEAATGAVARDTSSIIAPDSISVTYPLIIDGKKVYESSGYQVGLSVSVSIKEKRVTGVNNLTTQKYESSLYDAETDSAKILELAKTGGLYGYYYAQANKTYQVEIGTPELALFRQWNYTNGQSEELLVPALVFPVTKDSTEVQSYKQNVVVPLIKDFQQTNDGGPIKILPMGVPETAPAPAK